MSNDVIHYTYTMNLMQKPKGNEIGDPVVVFLWWYTHMVHDGSIILPLYVTLYISSIRLFTYVFVLCFL